MSKPFVTIMYQEVYAGNQLDKGDEFKGKDCKYEVLEILGFGVLETKVVAKIKVKVEPNEVDERRGLQYKDENTNEYTPAE